MGNLHLVTGYAGQEHVTAADHGAFNAALIGTGQFVLEKGNVFEAQVISNNQVRVLDGELMMQGRFVRLNPTTYVDLVIENGAQNVKRHDLIVARYTKNTTTGVEAVDLAVIKGNAVESNPVDPAFTEGDITNGEALLNEFPLWRIPLDGLNVGEPERLFVPFIDSMRTLPTIRQQVLDIHAEVDAQLADYDVAMAEKIGKIESYLKDEVLDEATKAEYGLDATSVPNDIFASLVKYSQHMWFRKASQSRLVQIAEEPVQIVAYDGSNSTSSQTIVVWNEIRINSNGVAVVNPAGNVRYGYSYYDDILEWKGRYVQIGGVVYCVGDNATATRDRGGKGYRTLWSLNLVTVKDLPSDDVSTYLFSPDENAYPHSGEADGYDYYYLGKPLDQTTKESLRFVRGWYTGTGVYGAENPNKLTFPFSKLLALFVVLADDGYSDSVKVVYFGQPGGGSRLTFTENGNTLEWYCDASSNGTSYQANIAETNYTYFAIGIDTDREEN